GRTGIDSFVGDLREPNARRHLSTALRPSFLNVFPRDILRLDQIPGFRQVPTVRGDEHVPLVHRKEGGIPASVAEGPVPRDLDPANTCDRCRTQTMLELFFRTALVPD